VSILFKLAIEKYRELRDEYEVVLAAAYEQAADATRGAMVNARGERAGVSDWDLFTHNDAFARAYASEELIEHWARHPRPTYTAYERQMVEEVWL
jgi:hypothetical protein